MRIGFLSRAVVYFLDGLISLLFYVCALIIGLFLGFFAINLSGGLEALNHAGDFEKLMVGRIAIGVGLTGTLLYYSLEIFCAGSLMKLAFGYRIRDSSGNPAGYSQLFMRFVSKHIAAICTLLFCITNSNVLSMVGGFGGFIIGLGFLMVLGGEKMALHDRIADTAVYPKYTEPEKPQEVITPQAAPRRSGAFDPTKDVLGRR